MIIRVKKDKGYFVASNKPFNDKSLSWEARGVLAYLLSKPDDWTVRNGDLYKQGPAGINKVKRILAELQKAGYLQRTRIRKPDGTFEWETTLYETPPTIAPKTIDGLPTDGKQCHIISTETNKDRKNKGKSSLPPYPSLRDGQNDDGCSSNSQMNHPAIQAVKQVTGYFPRKSLYAEVISLLGDEPDLKRLRQVYKLWIAKGYNPLNLGAWLFEWYPNGAYYTNPADRAVLEYLES